jgi:hypothetical protein
MARKVLITLAVLAVLGVAALYLIVRGAIGGDVVRRTLEEQLTARLGQPVRIASLGASFVPRVAIDLKDVSIGEPPVATIEHVSIATGLRGLISKRIEDAEIAVSQGRLPLWLALNLAGLAGGDPSSETAGFTLVSVRTFALRDVELAADSRSLRVDLEAALSGDRLDVTRLVAEAEGTRLEAHGTLSSIARGEGRFGARASHLNLDQLLAFLSDVSKAAESRGAGREGLKLEVGVSAPDGELGGYRFESLSSLVRISPSQVTVQPLQFRMFDGGFEGQLRVALTGASPQLTLHGEVNGMDVATILRETRGSKAMSGQLGGTVSVTSSGSSSAEILRRTRGTSRITITDGVMPGLEMVRSIVLAFGKPSGVPPAGSGSAFTRMGGAFTLDDQTLRSTGFTFASRDFDMAGEVAIGLPAGTIDMRADVVLSRELAAQAGTDLRRVAQEDGRVVVPARITGTIASPRVTIDPAAALSRAVQNEIRRKLQGLIKRIIR